MLPDRSVNKYAIQSVENALDVLEALSESPDEIRLSYLSQKLQLSKARIFRLLATFERRGYVEKEKTGKYRLGVAAYEVGQKLLMRLTLLRKAKPVMECLAWKCNEAVYLGIRKGSEVLLLDMIDTIEQVKIVSLLGNHYALDQVAAGVVLEAAEKSTKPDTGDAQRTFRKEGYAWDCGALGEGIISLAVPLRKSGGEICGALCLVGPDFRFSPERIELELLPNLKEAGDVISSKLGHVGQYTTGGKAPKEPAKTAEEAVKRGEVLAKRDRSAIIL